MSLDKSGMEMSKRYFNSEFSYPKSRTDKPSLIHNHLSYIVNDHVGAAVFFLPLHLGVNW